LPTATPPSLLINTSKESHDTSAPSPISHHHTHSKSVGLSALSPLQKKSLLPSHHKSSSSIADTGGFSGGLNVDDTNLQALSTLKLHAASRSADNLFKKRHNNRQKRISHIDRFTIEAYHKPAPMCYSGENTTSVSLSPPLVRAEVFVAGASTHGGSSSYGELIALNKNSVNFDTSLPLTTSTESGGANEKYQHLVKSSSSPTLSNDLSPAVTVHSDNEEVLTSLYHNSPPSAAMQSRGEESAAHPAVAKIARDTNPTVVGINSATSSSNVRGVADSGAMATNTNSDTIFGDDEEEVCS
jgi:hypothetical protein